MTSKFSWRRRRLCPYIFVRSFSKRTRGALSSLAQNSPSSHGATRHLSASQRCSRALVTALELAYAYNFSRPKSLKRHVPAAVCEVFRRLQQTSTVTTRTQRKLFLRRRFCLEAQAHPAARRSTASCHSTSLTASSSSSIRAAKLSAVDTVILSPSHQHHRTRSGAREIKYVRGEQYTYGSIHQSGDVETTA